MRKQKFKNTIAVFYVVVFWRHKENHLILHENEIEYETLFFPVAFPTIKENCVQYIYIAFSQKYYDITIILWMKRIVAERA